MRKLLIDTSVIIDFLRLMRLKKNETSLLAELSSSDLYASILTHAEVFSGKSIWEKEDNKKIVMMVFSGIQIVPLTLEISEYAGRIKAFHQNISLIDCIIATTAIQENLEMVTLNIKHFKSIEKLRLFND